MWWNKIFIDGTVHDVSKAICFGDTKIAEKILETTDVAQIKALGRKVSNYNETIWNGKRQILVYNGLCAKFQNPELKAKLKATGDAVLAECAVRDCIWGNWIVDDGS